MSRTKLLVLFFLVSLLTIPIGTVLAQGASDAEGTAIISDVLLLGDSITISMTDVPVLGDGLAYEGWLVPDDGPPAFSLGIMDVDGNGSINHTFVSEDGDNLINTYNKFVISIEPVPDDDPAPSANKPYFDEIPLAAMAHIRHLLADWPVGSGVGILANLRIQLDTAILHATLARDSPTITDVRLHLQHVINIIEGDDGANFDASAGQPGDGIGVLAHAQDRKHAGFAADAVSDATISEHAALVEEYGANAENWAIEARDEAMDLLDVSDVSVVQVLINQVLGPLDAARNGISATGEGGAEQAYVEGQLMATYMVPGRAPVEEGPVLPTVGDTTVPMLAQVALITSLLLLTAGGFLLIRDRRSRKRA